MIALVAAGLAMMSVQHFAPLNAAEHFVADVETAKFLPPQPQSPDVVIAAVTAATIDHFPYALPVDRGFLADLVTAVENDGPRAIWLDMIFLTPTEAEKDQALESVIARATVPLVVSYLDDPSVVTEDERQYMYSFVPPQVRGLAIFSGDGADGVDRWIEPGGKTGDGAFLPSVPRALLAKLGIYSDNRRIEIAWRGRPDSDTAPFRVYPAELVKALPRDWFAGKIVIIGVDVPQIDRHRTPFAVVGGSDAPGMMVGANAIDQLLDGRSPPGLGQLADGLITLAFAMFGAVAAGSVRSLAWRVILEISTIACIWIFSLTLFRLAAVRMPLVATTLALCLAWWAIEATIANAATRQATRIAP